MLYNMLPLFSHLQSITTLMFLLDMCFYKTSIIKYNSLQSLYNNKFQILRKHLCAMMMSY